MGLLPAALLLLAAFCSTAADAQATGDWRRAAGSGGGKPWPRRRLAAEGAVERGTPLSDDWRSIVTNETLAHLLKQTASPDGIVIFTTFALLSPKPEGAPQLAPALQQCSPPWPPAPVALTLAVLKNVVAMLRNFAYYLQRQGLLQHTLMLTTDEG